MFTYAHVKWFYGQSERAYYLNYFIIWNITKDLRKFWTKSKLHELKFKLKLWYRKYYCPRRDACMYF